MGEYVTREDRKHRRNVVVSHLSLAHGEGFVPRNQEPAYMAGYHDGLHADYTATDLLLNTAARESDGTTHAQRHHAGQQGVSNG